MNNDTSNDARMLRGVLLIVGGTALLLHTLGLIQEVFTFLLVAIAIAAIIYGFRISGLYGFLRDSIHWFSKDKGNSNTK